MNATQTTTARKIKLNKVLPGYYCWQNFTRGHSFEIIKNELGMWTVTHEQVDSDAQSITAATLDDARAYISATVYA